MSYADLASNPSTMATFKLHTTALVAAKAGVDIKMVQILRLYSGSVIMDIQVTSPASAKGLGGADPAALAKLDKALSSISASAASTFDSTFQSQFGITSVSAIIIVVASDPPIASVAASPSGTPSWVVPVAVSVSIGVSVVVAAVILGVVVMRRRAVNNIKQANWRVHPAPPRPIVMHGTPRELPEEIP